MTTKVVAHSEEPRPTSVLGGQAWWALAIVAAVATAYTTMLSLQLGLTVSLVAMSVGLYLRSRTAGVVAMWLIWLVAPMLRRLLGLTGPYLESDPLAVAPFLVTGSLATIELARGPVAGRLRTVLGVAGFGYLLGVATGLAASPPATAYSFLAYTAAVSAALIGYREAGEGGDMALRPTLLVTMPALAAYGLIQYFQPLPPWDDLWLKTVDFSSVGSPEEGRVRIFSTLNAPGTFAPMLAVSILCSLGSKRFDLPKAVGLMLILPALALTYVRGAWIALAVTLPFFLLLSRGRASWRLSFLALLVAVSIAIAGGRGETGAALTDRANTLANPGEDTSVQERLALSEFLPVALSRPLGHGLGQAGEATRLGGSPILRAPDNAYLSLLYQAGPFGLLLVAAAAALGVQSAWRAARRSAEPLDVLVAAVLFLLLILMLAGDILYGVTGVVFWYAIGRALRRVELFSGSSRPLSQEAS